MEADLPLSALLSQAYVAFAIEFDNEFEHQAPHRTTRYGATVGFPRAPWLVSMAMWLRFMRHIAMEGSTFSELQARVAMSNKGLTSWITRLGRSWGYLEIVDPDARRSSKRISPGAIIRPTAGGKRAIVVWQTLIPAIEARWRERFGNETVGALESRLKRLAGQLDPALPAYFPVLEYEDQKSRAARLRLPARDYVLPEVLAKALLGFAAEFDSQSQAPLALCANVLRATPDSGIPVRDLARLACLAADGANDALRQVSRKRLGVIGRDVAGGRLKVLTLTPKARLAREHYLPLCRAIEKDWGTRFGEVALRDLRRLLEKMVQGRGETKSPILRGLTPYPDGWRAQLPPLEGLPHFPMESHRGGFPDGS